MQDVKIRGVVVASPGDVRAERDALPAILDELNRGIAAERSLRLKLVRWETDVYPGFHPEGPQGLIDAVLRIDDCDILLSIFWRRFGTPVADAKPGTEHEFRRAYEAWQQQSRPHIMMYFNQRSYAPKTNAEAEQWAQVLEFRENFPKEGLWWPYKGRGQIEKLVHQHLTQLIRQSLPNASTGRRTQSQQPSKPPTIRARAQQHGSGAIAMGPGATTVGASGMAVRANIYGGIHISRPSEPEPSESLRAAYFHWLMEQVRALPSTGIDPKGIREETRRDLDLTAVYTALMTHRPETTARRELRPEHGVERLSALAVLNAEQCLALLGDPGSGKSMFVNFVALCMAGELLSHPDANLAVLTVPVPDDDTQRRRKEEPRRPQPWDHGPLIPMRVVLREFVAHGLLPAGRTVDVTSDTLWRYIVGEFPETLRSFEKPLRDELLNHGGLLLLDGLDEVPEADQRRAHVKAAVERFTAPFPRLHVLVTSRTHAYQRQDWKLNGFAACLARRHAPGPARTALRRRRRPAARSVGKPEG
jgi:hypothetical protein